MSDQISKSREQAVKRNEISILYLNTAIFWVWLSNFRIYQNHWDRIPNLIARVPDSLDRRLGLGICTSVKFTVGFDATGLEIILWEQCSVPYLPFYLILPCFHGAHFPKESFVVVCAFVSLLFIMGISKPTQK